MIDSLLDYPCVTTQTRVPLKRGAPHTLCVTPFQITHYSLSHVINSFTVTRMLDKNMQATRATKTLSFKTKNYSRTDPHCENRPLSVSV